MTETTERPMRALDLFAGAGGWDVAAQRLGIDAHGVENMPEAVATRDAAGLTTVHDDVWTFGHSGWDGTYYDGLIASPPCQTFSKAGKGSGRKALNDVLAAIDSGAWLDLDELRAFGEQVGDARTALVLTPLHYAIRMRPEWLAWEQVPSVLPVWEACAEVLRSQGYYVWTGTVNTEQYGVPQSRKRAVLIASRTRAVSMPTPTHSKFHSRTPDKLDAGVARWVTMAEAMGWDQHDLVGFPRRADSDDVVTMDGVDYRARDLRSADQPAQTVTEKARSWQRFSDVTLATPAHDRAYDASVPRSGDQPAPTVAFGHAAAQWQWRLHDAPEFVSQSGTEVDEQWPWKRPSTTVAGRDLVQNPGATANRFNGSTKSRNDGVRLSVAEAGVLQSFPPEFPWQGAQTKQYLQAGNAVPVLMAEAVLGEAISAEQVGTKPLELAAGAESLRLLEAAPSAAPTVQVVAEMLPLPDEVDAPGDDVAEALQASADEGPCCYGHVTSGGQVHEVGCLDDDGSGHSMTVPAKRSVEDIRADITPVEVDADLLADVFGGPDPVATLVASVDLLDRELDRLVEAADDPEGAAMCLLLADVRAQRERLYQLEALLEREAAKALMGDDLVVDGVCRVERYTSRDRKEWRHDDWQRDVRAKALRRHNMLHATVVTPDGEALPDRVLYDLLADVQGVHGAGAPKSTSLKSLGLAADDYCSSQRGTTKVRVTRIVSETPGDDQ